MPGRHSFYSLEAYRLTKGEKKKTMMTALQCIIIEIGIVRVEEASELGIRKGKA